MGGSEDSWTKPVFKQGETYKKHYRDHDAPPAEAPAPAEQPAEPYGLPPDDDDANDTHDHAE
ncbi:hypothetical protein [Compostimonas suwonensis]|uniref:Uncharacterized protein n=1 Tax=Compostimonas suwonensis TaxID=1048394 RepID=A0A2M9BZC6_9MICO|nr:hypothetical protein [Compostimonas suwonensis]PJJ63428.1 hypothetical protein CLV54_1093 [Compostimonas suwonensis]